MVFVAIGLYQTIWDTMERHFELKILSPLRLPFRHPGVFCIVGFNDVSVKMLVFHFVATGQIFDSGH